MKDGLQQILGKRIAAVVVASNDRAPRQQVFLVFHDGTRFEFYGESFTCCGGVDKARDLEQYVESAKGKIETVYVDSRPKARIAQTTSACPEDYSAWRSAVAAIEKAKR